MLLDCTNHRQACRSLHAAHWACSRSSRLRQRAARRMEVARLDAFDDGGEGAAGAGAAPVWVKYSDGAVDEVEREVRATSCATAMACAGRLWPPC